MAKKSKTSKLRAFGTQESAALPAAPANAPELASLVPISAPTFHATSVAIQALSTDVSLIFHRTAPASQGAEIVAQKHALQQVVAIIQMSPHALKDLSIILPEVVAQMEKAFGVLQTEFTKKRDAEQSAKSSSTKPSSIKRH